MYTTKVYITLYVNYVTHIPDMLFCMLLNMLLYIPDDHVTLKTAIRLFFK